MAQSMSMQVPYPKVTDEIESPPYTGVRGAITTNISTAICEIEDLVFAWLNRETDTEGPLAEALHRFLQEVVPNDIKKLQSYQTLCADVSRLRANLGKSQINGKLSEKSEPAIEMSNELRNAVFLEDLTLRTIQGWNKLAKAFGGQVTTMAVDSFSSLIEGQADREIRRRKNMLLEMIFEISHSSLVQHASPGGPVRDAPSIRTQNQLIDRFFTTEALLLRRAECTAARMVELIRRTEAKIGVSPNEKFKDLGSVSRMARNFNKLIKGLPNERKTIQVLEELRGRYEKHLHDFNEMKIYMVVVDDERNVVDYLPATKRQSFPGVAYEEWRPSREEIPGLRIVDIKQSENMFQINVTYPKALPREEDDLYTVEAVFEYPTTPEHDPELQSVSAGFKLAKLVWISSPDPGPMRYALMAMALLRMGLVDVCVCPSKVYAERTAVPNDMMVVDRRLQIPPKASTVLVTVSPALGIGALFSNDDAYKDSRLTGDGFPMLINQVEDLAERLFFEITAAAAVYSNVHGDPVSSDSIDSFIGQIEAIRDTTSKLRSSLVQAMFFATEVNHRFMLMPVYGSPEIQSAFNRLDATVEELSELCANSYDLPPDLNDRIGTIMALGTTLRNEIYRRFLGTEDERHCRRLRAVLDQGIQNQDVLRSVEPETGRLPRLLNVLRNIGSLRK